MTARLAGTGITRQATVAALLWLLAIGSWVRAESQTMPDVQVNGLMPNQAVVMINGQQRILRAGKQSPEGVLLISADSRKAVFSWHDQQFERTISKQITSQFSERSKSEEARITRGHNDHYFTPGHINGQLVDFMVDTGASSIAMSYHQADQLGLDWRKGARFMASTAGGDTPGYRVVLESVSVDGITLRNVEAAVVVADTGTDILLGMTFLSRTEMHEEDGVLVLRKKY